MLKNEYDFICSLGANCSAASQLKKRGLRDFALPFDWTWFNSEDALYNIAEGFENNFCKFMQKDKLRKLKDDECSKQHNDKCQYQDMNTKIYYFNHFYKTKNDDKAKDTAIKTFRKRCKRLIDYLERAENVLMVLSIHKEIDIESVKNLVDVLKRRFPNTNVDIVYQCFNAKKEESSVLSNLEIKKYQRPENDYDYHNTNYEWNFLDEIKLTNKFDKPLNRLFKLTRVKRGMRIAVLKNINTVFYLKLYLFGTRLQICFGKHKAE